jgi:hypothetical protein
MIECTLYLLPCETDAHDAVGIKSTALSVDARSDSTNSSPVNPVRG